MSTVIQFPNASASKVIQPKRKGRYPSKVTKLRTAWLKRYEKTLANKEKTQSHKSLVACDDLPRGSDYFYSWLASMLECLKNGGERAASEFLRTHPAQSDWAECAGNLLRHIMDSKHSSK